MSGDRAVGVALARLVEQGVLSGAQRDAVVAEVARERADRASGGRWLAEVAAYAGAGLVLGGVVLLLDSAWDDLGKVAQLGVMAVVIVGLVAGGYAVAGGRAALFRGRASAVGAGAAGGSAAAEHGPGVPDSVPAGPDSGAGAIDRGRTSVAPPGSARARLGSALFALAAVCVAIFVGMALDGSSGEDWVWPVTAGLIAAVAGYAALPSFVGLFACAGFAPAAVAGVLDRFDGSHDVVFGLALLVLAGIWFAVSFFGYAEPTWAGYTAAVLTGLAGAQTAGDAGRPWAYGLTVLVAAVCFGLYGLRRHSVLVIGGALALAIGASTAVWDWTGGTAAAFVIVLIVGAVVLGAGVALLVREPRALREQRSDTGTPG
ncbi:DUF2157 domain-containing protein [Nocardia sp. NPDC055321]